MDCATYSVAQKEFRKKLESFVKSLTLNFGNSKLIISSNVQLLMWILYPKRSLRQKRAYITLF